MDEEHIRTIIDEIVGRLSRGEPVTQGLIDKLPRTTRVEMPVRVGGADGKQVTGVICIEGGRVTFTNQCISAASKPRLGGDLLDAIPSAGATELSAIVASGGTRYIRQPDAKHPCQKSRTPNYTQAEGGQELFEKRRKRARSMARGGVGAGVECRKGKYFGHCRVQTRLRDWKDESCFNREPRRSPYSSPLSVPSLRGSKR